MNLTIASLVGTALLAGVLLLVCMRPARAENPESIFVAAFRAKVEKMYPNAKISHVGPTHIRVEPADNGTVDYFLDSAIAEYRAAPDNLSAIVESRLQPPSGQSTRSSVLPVIRSADWMERVKSQLLAVGATSGPFANSLPITRALAPGLIVAYAKNEPENLTYVTPSELEPLGLAGADGLHALALENLSVLARNRHIVGKNGRYRIELDDVFESSLALLSQPTLVSNLKIEGDIVVALPARNALLICGSQDEESISGLKEVAARIHKSAAHPIATNLYRITPDGTWQPLDAI